MKSLLLSLTFLLSLQVCGQVPTTNTPLQVLSQQGPNLSAWVLAPIDRSIPDQIRQNITFLREDLVDEGKAKPRASVNAYSAAYQYCTSLIAALDEREKMLLKAGYRAVQANVVTPATNQALEARRNYMMSWPQYEREVQQRNDLLRVGEAADQRKVELALQELKLEWANRATPLRTNLDALYMKLRAALRESGVTSQTFDGAQGGSKSDVPTIPAVPPPSVTPNAPVSPQGTFTNSLGMKFVPVPGTNVLMCIHETRYKDYAAYAVENADHGDAWIDQTWSDYALTDKGDEHPVTKVSWEDAKRFCEWMSQKEGQVYRLPTDAEWSHAVGIGKSEKWEKRTTPSTVFKHPSAFPWGDQWPPPSSSGNYSDQSLLRTGYQKTVLKDYDDNFPTTAPVMSFKPNKLGVYDLEGNAREWVEDWWDDNKKERVIRGGAWFYAKPEELLSSYRIHAPPTFRTSISGLGFRVVVVGNNPVRSSDVDPPPTSMPPKLTRPDSTVVKVLPNSPNGYDLGAIGRGEGLTLQYMTGRWKSYGTYATESPDSLELERKDKSTENMCVIAEAADSDGFPGPIVAVVPPKTETVPFQFTADKDYPRLVLRILSNSRRKENPGEALYMLSRASQGSSNAHQPHLVSAKPSRPQPLPAERRDSSRVSFVNSLRMQFVPVPETTVMMCIHETRNIDYAAYADSEKMVNDEWRSGATGKEQHPVTNVSHEDAEGFCRWLSRMEGKVYRLPTDAEWSASVGLGREVGNTPRQKADHGPEDVFPWGSYWPPTPGDGNYGFMAIDDGYVTTAPVMSFRPNALGIYDLGGNVAERCSDGSDGSNKFRLLRGASWAAYDRVGLRSKSRDLSEHTKQRDVVGFRCVVEVDGARPRS